MATTKKPATKKRAVKPAAAKVAPKKSTPRAAASKKKGAATSNSHRLFSISLVPDSQPFMTFRLTTQTIYWLIFAVTVLALSLWVLRLNLEIVSLYDQIDQNNLIESQTSSVLHKTTKH